MLGSRKLFGEIEVSEHQIRTLNDLLISIPTSGMLKYAGSLEEYLRGLWRVVEKNRHQTPSAALIEKMLNEAAIVEPTPFDEDWFRYEQPPYDQTYQEENDNSFEYLKRTLLFQIADLRRMREAGTLNLSPITLFGGVDSSSGNRWYNFHVVDYFECGERGYRSHCENFGVRNEWLKGFPPIGRPINSTECTWRDLAELLEFGRVYE